MLGKRQQQFWSSLTYLMWKAKRREGFKATTSEKGSNYSIVVLHDGYSAWVDMFLPHLLPLQLSLHFSSIPQTVCWRIYWMMLWHNLLMIFFFFSLRSPPPFPNKKVISRVFMVESWYRYSTTNNQTPINIYYCLAKKQQQQKNWKWK